jgi:hypothetical protein
MMKTRIGPSPFFAEPALSAWEVPCFAGPKGQPRIAQRFNAGLDTEKSRVPKGRLRSNPTCHASAVPSGLVCYAGSFPALKRRAILKTSLRDKGTRVSMSRTNSECAPRSKAAEDRRTPRRRRVGQSSSNYRQVWECAAPAALWITRTGSRPLSMRKSQRAPS